MQQALLYRAGLAGPLEAELLALLAPFALTETDTAQGWYLTLQDSALVLRNADLPKQGDILVDFASGAATHRRKFGGGKAEGIAKAVGLNKKPALARVKCRN